MLPETAKNSLAETTIQSLETMAFIVAEPISGPADPPVNPFAAAMSFSGATGGRVEIIASREFCLIFASSMLGTDPTDADAIEKSDDCLKELVNVVGGALMPHLANTPRDQFALGLPTIRPVDVELEWPIIASDATTQLFNADGHILAARILPG